MSSLTYDKLLQLAEGFPPEPKPTHFGVMGIGLSRESGCDLMPGERRQIGDTLWTRSDRLGMRAYRWPIKFPEPPTKEAPPCDTQP